MKPHDTQSILKTKSIDALLINSAANISYLTNYISRDSYLLISKKENIYFTDSRYTQEAKKKLNKNFVIEEIGISNYKSFAVSIYEACLRLKIKKIGFEEKHLYYSQYKKLKEDIKKPLSLAPTRDIIEEIRQIKSTDEINKIKEAINITIKAFNYIKKFIIPGKKEIEIAGQLENYIRHNGATGTSFDIIVASGPNSSFPHHLTSHRKIAKNEPVLIDLGVCYRGYKSDLTRVYFSGKMFPLMGKVYQILINAQERAIKEIKPSVKIKNIDTTARQYIANEGFGGFFNHSLGHGIGLEIHELPHISPKQNSELKEGMVFTIEPGIYLPGKFGIRIEDMVLVTKKGAEILSGSLNK
ncbi:MAG: aminopeptidase P family protein [Candidatus Omnitrophota bacterium]